MKSTIQNVKKSATTQPVKKLTEKEIFACDEEKLAKKYKNIIRGTLRVEKELKRRSVVAKLACGHEERVHTSDLFQVKMCEACRKIAKTAKVKEFKEKLTSGKISTKKAAPTPVKKSSKTITITTKPKVATSSKAPSEAPNKGW